MKYFFTFLILVSCLQAISFQKKGQKKIPLNSVSVDTFSVVNLNEQGFTYRLTDPDKSIKFGKKSLSISKKLKYAIGSAEAYRIIGIGYYYLNERDSAINNYLQSLTYYQELENELGQAKVMNNIGNLYSDYDNKRALEYFNKTLKIAIKLQVDPLIGGTYLNIGNIHYRTKDFILALKNYQKSYEIFKKIKNSTGITQSLQNSGVIYLKIKNLEKAEELLLQANAMAKSNELDNPVASINMTLGKVYMAKKQYDKAEKILKEGQAFAEKVKDEEMIYDYIYIYYELEQKRENFEKALKYLKRVYDFDSIAYKNNIANGLYLNQKTNDQQRLQDKSNLIIAEQKNTRILFISSCIVAGLAFIVIFLLIRDVKKRAKTNKQLTLLNLEVSRQKDNVDKINLKLEEIIAERTKDLVVKNQKLSEYSSHLSHQIRGPVATLKGLVMLAEDNMIEAHELVPAMKKCVDNIDDKIIDMNEALHDPNRPNLKDV